MIITKKLLLAPILALSITGPALAQSVEEGDYYAPGPATMMHVSPGQMRLNEQGDYYAGETTFLTARRISALRACTDGVPFASDRYIACMARQGEAP
jgi:hypothetical protein